MKKFIIAVPFCLSLLYADISIQEIEQMVKKIHLKREGISLEVLENTKEPFIRVKKEDNVTAIKAPKKEVVVLKLHAIMAGKAFINDEWKKVDEKILGYTVKYIGKKGVVLRNGNTIKKLFLGKPKNNLITLEERD